LALLIGTTQAMLDSGLMVSSQSVLYYFGVGIYEELVFRLLAIAVLHGVLVDLIHMPEKTGAVTAVLVSAVIFALAHHRPSSGSMLDFIQSGRFVFCLLAGVYLAAVYLLRGFGIVAATHAFYDVTTLFVPRLSE
ncbi:MAG: CPBP family intramembrane glutamic endopeptidase, partial [Phycisphaeraceae bacterium]|nr:CPBP family intramembrane glutamic endopeptidase [Phycisphaeraceae bacterium]